jgi:hypothetical protein
MSERENGQLPLVKRTVRDRISSERWEQIKTAKHHSVSCQNSFGYAAKHITANSEETEKPQQGR